MSQTENIVCVCLFFLSCWLNTSLNFFKPFAITSTTFLWTYQWPFLNPSCKEFKVCPFSRDWLKSYHLLVLMASDQMESDLVSKRFMSWLAWFTLTYAVLAGLLNFALEWYVVSFFSISYIQVCMGLSKRNYPYISKYTNCASLILCSHECQHPLRSRGFSHGPDFSSLLDKYSKDCQIWVLTAWQDKYQRGERGLGFPCVKTQWIYSGAGEGIFSCASGCSRTNRTVVPFTSSWWKQHKLWRVPYFGMFLTTQLSGPAANLTLTSVWLLAWHNLTKSLLEMAEKEKNYSLSLLLTSGIIT